MDKDMFDYDELSRNVDDLLNDEYGVRADDYDMRFDDDLPSSFPVRNAANGYGANQRTTEQLPQYDEEAAAMHYDPQTNSGAVIRAYNADYASRAVQKAQRKAPQQKRPVSGKRRPSKSEPRRPKEKRSGHPFVKILFVLLLLLALFTAALWFFSKQPADSLGAHKEDCTAILLAGTDADGVRTDTMMILYIDRAAGEMNLLSLPRDTYTRMDIAVPKLNAVYGVAGGGKDGMERLMDYTKECIGYRPDGYVLIDLDGFERIVDLMGGVRFYVPCDMEYEDPTQDLHIDLTEGEQKLNGKEAMWVVRYRSGYALADLQRVQVQRNFMIAAMDQWLSVKNIWKAPAAAAMLTADTTTNLSLRELSWIAQAAKAIGTEDMKTETLPGEAANIQGGSYYVLWPETTAKLINASYNPYKEDVSPETIYSPYY